MIDRKDALPMTRQCTILGISRSSLYYRPVASERDRDLMRLIDEIHLDCPFYGSRKIRDALRVKGHTIGRDHVSTLMRRMGIRPLYQKRRLSKSHPAHKVYPYLLRGLDINHSNQVWAADICYLPMARGFCYLVAVMDWASRKVLSFRLSNTLDASFCVEALEDAIRTYGAPDIFNTDQGSQFTSDEFTNVLLTNGIKISMDGRGRWRDNVFIERLWRSVKYEEVYLKAYESVTEARRGLKAYFTFYNERRHHQALDSRTPDEVYWGTLPEKAAS
jgi:putative transposase